MKPTAVRTALLLALAAAAASTGCMGAFTAQARFNPIASDREDLEHAQPARIQVYVSLGSSAAVFTYVVLFFYVTALYPLSQLIYAWADAFAISLLLWASAATGGLLSPHLPGLAVCHTPLCRLALAGSVLKWLEVLMLIAALAAVIITKLRHPLVPWSLALEHLPTYRPDDEPDTHTMTMRALYESQLLNSVSLASTAAPPGIGGTFGRNTLYAVASPSAVALPLPAHSRQSKRASRLSARFSRPITYFNSWAEGTSRTGEAESGSLSPARPRPERDSWGYGKL